jgi:hypothetical protein
LSVTIDVSYCAPAAQDFLEDDDLGSRARLTLVTAGMAELIVGFFENATAVGMGEDDEGGVVVGLLP